MTMIPLSSPATSGLSPDLAALGALHSIFRRSFREPRGSYHLAIACSRGRCNYAPATSCQVKRQLVCFHAAPVFGPCCRVEYAFQPATGLEGTWIIDGRVVRSQRYLGSKCEFQIWPLPGPPAGTPLTIRSATPGQSISSLASTSNTSAASSTCFW